MIDNIGGAIEEALLSRPSAACADRDPARGAVHLHEVAVPQPGGRAEEVLAERLALQPVGTSPLLEERAHPAGRSKGKPQDLGEKACTLDILSTPGGELDNRLTGAPHAGLPSLAGTIHSPQLASALTALLALLCAAACTPGQVTSSSDDPSSAVSTRENLSFRFDGQLLTAQSAWVTRFPASWEIYAYLPGDPFLSPGLHISVVGPEFVGSHVLGAPILAGGVRNGHASYRHNGEAGRTFYYTDNKAQGSIVVAGGTGCHPSEDRHTRCLYSGTFSFSALMQGTGQVHLITDGRFQIWVELED